MLGGERDHTWQRMGSVCRIQGLYVVDGNNKVDKARSRPFQRIHGLKAAASSSRLPSAHLHLTLHEHPSSPAQSRVLADNRQPAIMQTAMTMNVVPAVQAPRVSRATLQRPAARTASFASRVVSNGSRTKAMQVRNLSATSRAVNSCHQPSWRSALGLSHRRPA